MKRLRDGFVPERCYYYLLDYKDINMEEFQLLTGKQSVGGLTVAEFWKAFDYVVISDKNMKP